MKILHILFVLLLISITAFPLIAQDTTATEYPIFTDKPYEPFAQPIDSCYVEDQIFQNVKTEYNTAKKTTIAQQNILNKLKLVYGAQSEVSFRIHLCMMHLEIWMKQ